MLYRISFGKTPKVLLQAWDNFIEAKHAQPEEVQELLSKLVQDVKIISDELSEYINTPAWNRPLVYCDDDDDEDYTIAITPVLSTEEPVNSLIMEDEHLDTISATESDEFIKSSVEILVPIPNQSEDFSDSNVDSTSTDEDSFSSNDVEYVEASPPNSEPVSSKVMEIVIPEVGRIEDDILLIKDDTLRETLLNVNRLVAKIEALKDNPVPSSVVMTKSTSTFSNLLLEETNTFDNSLPELETFCFNLEEPSSGSPTTHSELSLPDYKAFYIDNDHFKEKSSGSTTTHVDFSQYDSFIFDLSINSYHPSNRSDFHEEFADELAQIISQPEYDRFCFKIEPELGNLTMDVVGNIFQESEPRVHVLNVLPTLELAFIPSSESIFAYVVWIFLPFLFIPVIPPYLLSCGDEDTIFDPGISKEVDINKKTENQAKMTKLSMEWKRLCKIKAKVQIMSIVRVNTEESAVKPEPELKNTIGCNLYPSDGPGKPNSIFMKTVKTKWALNQFQQPICVQLTKTVKTLKAQS
ncbi:hypothetical protein Tco_1093278 [Tanacetum coccineum]|uniref:Uncharacterized protein n=1 Tax=Tanacetum coccineum TaxID=301880 RepID=A0ABQ5ICA8_9ASTR